MCLSKKHSSRISKETINTAVRYRKKRRETPLKHVAQSGIKLHNCQMDKSQITYNVRDQKIWDIYQMEQITYSLRLQKPAFTKRWKTVIVLLIQ